MALVQAALQAEQVILHQLVHHKVMLEEIQVHTLVVAEAVLVPLAQQDQVM